MQSVPQRLCYLGTSVKHNYNYIVASIIIMPKTRRAPASAMTTQDEVALGLVQLLEHNPVKEPRRVAAGSDSIETTSSLEASWMANPSQSDQEKATIPFAAFFQPPDESSLQDQLGYVHSFLCEHYPEEAESFRSAASTRRTPAIFVNTSKENLLASGALEQVLRGTDVAIKLTHDSFTLGSVLDEYTLRSLCGDLRGLDVMRCIRDLPNCPFRHLDVKGRRARGRGPSRNDDTHGQRTVPFTDFIAGGVGACLKCPGASQKLMTLDANFTRSNWIGQVCQADLGGAMPSLQFVHAPFLTETHVDNWTVVPCLKQIAGVSLFLAWSFVEGVQMGLTSDTSSAKWAEKDGSWRTFFAMRSSRLLLVRPGDFVLMQVTPIASSPPTAQARGLATSVLWRPSTILLQPSYSVHPIPAILLQPSYASHPTPAILPTVVLTPTAPCVMVQPGTHHRVFTLQTKVVAYSNFLDARTMEVGVLILRPNLRPSLRPIHRPSLRPNLRPTLRPILRPRPPPSPCLRPACTTTLRRFSPPPLLASPPLFSPRPDLLRSPCGDLLTPHLALSLSLSARRSGCRASWPSSIARSSTVSPRSSLHVVSYCRASSTKRWRGGSDGAGCRRTPRRAHGMSAAALLPPRPRRLSLGLCLGWSSSLRRSAAARISSATD